MLPSKSLSWMNILGRLPLRFSSSKMPKIHSPPLLMHHSTCVCLRRLVKVSLIARTVSSISWRIALQNLKETTCDVQCQWFPRHLPRLERTRNPLLWVDPCPCYQKSSGYRPSDKTLLRLYRNYQSKISAIVVTFNMLIIILALAWLGRRDRREVAWLSSTSITFRLEVHLTLITRL